MADRRLLAELPQLSRQIAEAPIPSLAEICESPHEFVGKVDVGTLNAICATGLPGAEDMDVAKQSAWFDEAAQQVEVQTRAHFDEFTRNPALYDYSPGKFCCEYLLRTLQELLGVHYNPARIRDSGSPTPLCATDDFRDSRDLFIHGITSGHGGTCASMPVAYVAAGRRRGYPLKLVEAPGHLFFRWEDPEGKLFNVPEVFNVDGAGHGISFHPDDYYRTWPRE